MCILFFNEDQKMKCLECDGCVHYLLVRNDPNGKNQKRICSNTDRHCYERLQFFNRVISKLKELKNDVEADIMELKRNQEMISECVGRLSTIAFILELLGEKVIVMSNYQNS